MNTIHLHSKHLVFPHFKKTVLCGRYEALSAHISCFDGEKLSWGALRHGPEELCGSCVERYPLALLGETELE